MNYKNIQKFVSVFFSPTKETARAFYNEYFEWLKKDPMTTFFIFMKSLEEYKKEQYDVYARGVLFGIILCTVSDFPEFEIKVDEYFKKYVP